MPFDNSQYPDTKSLLLSQEEPGGMASKHTSTPTTEIPLMDSYMDPRTSLVRDSPQNPPAILENMRFENRAQDS